MPVVGSNITIDLHITGDADVDSIRGAMRRDSRIHPKLAEDLQRAIERRATLALQEHEITDCDLSVALELVEGRVPGSPRERIRITLDAEGDKPVVASVDEAVGTPERARIADDVEEIVQQYLDQHQLAGEVSVTVSVTPIQFR